MSVIQKAFIALIFIDSLSRHSGANTTVPVIFDNGAGLGREFEGIGGISGGGATSKLLVNYPQPQRDQILDYLFKPNFAASLQLLKVEIGGDVESTDGTEASHMHNSWDENYDRGYEWWLMKEAKKRNPSIKLYSLPWGFPGWIGQGTRSPWTKPKVTADYIVRWINGAKVHHNLTIDYVGIWNERRYSIDYIKTLRMMLDSRGFNKTLIIAADEHWEISKDILADAELSKAIHAIGCHYPGTKSTDSALNTSKPLWASEDYSTFNNEVGGGCWARILNQNYVNGYMTSTITWNLIASYYPGLPFYRDGLMTAVQPWSGNFVVNTPIWVSAHTTQFVPIGWKYLKHSHGVGHLPKGGSYVSLTDPSEKELTIVIETMSHDHSKCIRPYLPAYSVSPQNVTIVLSGNYKNIKVLHMWYSKLGFNGAISKMFQKLQPVLVTNSQVNLTLALDEIITLTTLATGQKGQYTDPPPPKVFPLPYMDDFEKYPVASEPFLLSPQVGTLEIIQTQNSSHKQVARQMVQSPPLNWCLVLSNSFPFAIIGNESWTDIYASVEFSLSPVNGSTGAFIAARVDQGGCTSYLAHGIFFFAFPDKYIISNDLARTKVLKEGKFKSFKPGEWHKLALTIKDGNITASFDDYDFSVMPMPSRPANGFVAIGTDNFGLADFDNLVIDSAKSRELRTSKSYHDSSSVIS